MSRIIKSTTGLTGLKVDPNARRNLAIVYGKIVRVLQKLPADYAYRQHTEKLVKERADVVKNVEDVSEIECKIGCGQIEELISQANSELNLARNILEWNSWEPNAQTNIAAQWTWPPHA